MVVYSHCGGCKQPIVTIFDDGPQGRLADAELKNTDRRCFNQYLVSGRVADAPQVSNICNCLADIAHWMK